MLLLFGQSGGCYAPIRAMPLPYLNHNNILLAHAFTHKYIPSQCLSSLSPKAPKVRQRKPLSKFKTESK